MTTTAVRESVERHTRPVRKQLARLAPVRAALAAPRTLDFMVSSWKRNRRGFARPDGLPAAKVSPAMAVNVALDESILSLAMGPNRFPRRADYERVGAELEGAIALYEREGWLDNPLAYHQVPPPLTDPFIGPARSLNGIRYEHLQFESGYEPHPGEPAAERWNHLMPNKTAHAWVLRHDDGPRPWLLCLHGLAQGFATGDFFGFRVKHLHEDFGLNIAFPVLPLHGPRKVTRMSGESFLSFDLMESVLGVAQSIWDVRRVLDWVRRQTPLGVGTYGISLGGHIGALLAGIDDRIDSIICGVPIADLSDMFRHHSPLHLRMRAVEHNLLGPVAEAAQSVVSPLTFAPLVPADRRYMFAGTGDRMTGPAQAHMLWKHWDGPRTLWYEGSHVGFMWSSDVKQFVDESLHDSGLI